MTLVGAGLLSALLVAATLGEGGVSPTAILAIHAAVAAAWGVILVRPGSGGRPVRRAAGAPVAAFLLFAAVALAGAAFAPYAYAAWLRILEIAAFLGILLLAARTGPVLLDVLPYPLLIGAAAQSVHVLAARFLQAEPRPAGTFLNPNHLAGWLVAVLLLALGTWRAGSGRVSLRVRIGLALPVVAALFVIGSRGAFLALAAGLGWLLLSSWQGLSRRSRTALVVAGCLVGLAAGLAVVQRFRTPDPYSIHRALIWKASTRVFLDHPWTGTGPGQFKWASRNYQFPDGTPPLQFERRFRTTHSDWIRAGAEYGLPGLAAVLLALGLAAREIGRGRRRGKTVPAGAVAALVALGAQTAVDNPSERPALWLLSAVLLGALLSRPAESRAGPGGAVRVLALVLLAVTFVAGDVAPYRAWRLERGGELEEATGFNPVHPDLWMRRAEALAGDGPGWTPQTYAEARTMAERAVRLNPADSEMRLRLARIEARACLTIFPDDRTRARAVGRFREAQARARCAALIPLEQGEFLYRTRDWEGALRSARRVLELEPNAIPPRLLAARALLRLGGEERTAEASTLVREARESAQRWENYRREDAYSRELLNLDEEQAEWIEGKIGERNR